MIELLLDFPLGKQCDLLLVEPSSSAPKLFIDLRNSSNHTQPYPTIVDYYHHCHHLHDHYDIGQLPTGPSLQSFK